MNTTNDVLKEIHNRDISNVVSNFTGEEIVSATKSIRTEYLFNEIETREDFVNKKLFEVQYVLSNKLPKCNTLMDKEKVVKELREILGIKEK